MNTPTIEDVLKKHVMKDKEMDADMFADWSKQESYQLMLTAMQEWASLQTPSNEKYGWVKASERLPEVGKKVFIRWKHRLTKQDEWETLYDTTKVMVDPKYWKLEWLDETPSPSCTDRDRIKELGKGNFLSTMEAEYWRKRCEAAEEHITVLCNHPKGKIRTEAWKKWQQLKSSPIQ